MNQLTPKQRARVLACLVEGNSMRATQRMTGFAKKTVERVLREAGEVCAKLLDERMQNLPCTQIQCDEIWAFVGCKDKHRSTYTRFNSGAEVFTNKRGRCEDAPCCGCCS